MTPRRRSEPKKISSPVRKQGSNPFPTQARISPALRANPFPEVTDLTCRLPLPTLIYRLEAVHLGDRMRIWVRISVKVRILPLDFQVPDRRSADAARNAALFRDKTLSPSDPIHKAIHPVNQKRQLFPALRSDSPGWFLSYD